MSWLFLTTGLISFILIPSGLFANHIVVFFVGLVGVSCSSLLFALTATKKWKGYGGMSPISWFFRIIAIGISYLCFYLAHYYFDDVESYTEKEYMIIEGIPDEIIYAGHGTKGIEMITVNMQGESFYVIPKAEYYLNIEQLKGRTFKVYFLPKTKWVVRYDVL